MPICYIDDCGMYGDCIIIWERMIEPNLELKTKSMYFAPEMERWGNGARYIEYIYFN